MSIVVILKGFLVVFLSMLKNWVFSKIHTIMEKYSFDVGFMHICCKQHCFVEHTHE
jgi:hypothetical protein